VTGAATISPLLDRLLAEDAAPDEPTPEWRSAYRKAAAVLASFEPLKLQPFQHELVPEAWHELLPECEPVDLPGKAGRWRLHASVRREALTELVERNELALALANSPQADRSDPLQLAIERIVNGTPLDLFELKREDLAALSVAREWFDGLLKVPSEDELRAALPIAEVLAPMHRLADAFVGRVSELAQLEDFVGVLDARSLRSVGRRAAQSILAKVAERVPLFVHGPGGIGKSTLIAKFVLEHFQVRPELRLPFAYLDIDRPALDPQQPLTLLCEMARQLSTQFPSIARPLKRMTEEIRADLLRYDRIQTDKALTGNSRHTADFTHWVNASLADVTRQPLLVVIDTFEEAQFLGPVVVHGVWEMLQSLQRGIDSLRVIVAGRVLPRDVSCTPLVLSELDAYGAHALLRSRLDSGDTNGSHTDDDMLDTIIAIVGRSPMSLRFAAQIVESQGIGSLRAVETRNFLFLRLRAEKVQAQLYGRILAHIHDPLVRKLAYPGLIVRRITPDVIREVLAGPCGVPLNDAGDAEMLFDALAREVALVEDDGPRAVRHRLDVRRMMLRDLVANVLPATVKQIDESAVLYYASSTGPRARAEEIYHRLRLGHPHGEIAARWLPGVEETLRAAVEELPPPEQIWLTTRLGATPDAQLLAQADLETWEENVARDAQRAIQGGSPKLALEMISARKERTPSSPLYRIEAQADRLSGNDEAARECASRGIESASASGNRELAVQLHLLIAAIDEGDMRLDVALKRLETMRELVDPKADVLPALSVYAARIRVRRLLGPTFEGEREILSAEANALLTSPVMTDVRARPALLRELVAELGPRNAQLLRDGLEIVGLEVFGQLERQQFIDNILELGPDVAQPLFRAALGNDLPEVGLSLGTSKDLAATLASSGFERIAVQLLFSSGYSSPGLVTLIVHAFRAAVALSVRRKSQ
jgi:hypothetical protein